MKQEGLRKPETREGLPSRIELDFFRHSIKENDPSKNDVHIRLTREGGLLAKNKSQNQDLTQAVAFGSPRERTQETALKVMAGGTGEITGEESLEEIQAQLDGNWRKASKLGVDARLDFLNDETTPLGRASYDAFLRKEYMKFMVEKSDALAREVGDTEGSTYSRQAAGVAQIIEKYLTIAPRWHELVNDPNKDYKDTLKRFLGTHLGVGESFLAKAIELTQGVHERDAFIEALAGQGFDYTEGFKIEITSGGKEPSLHLSYKKEKEGKTVFDFNAEVPLEVISRIAREGET